MLFPLRAILLQLHIIIFQE